MDRLDQNPHRICCLRRQKSSKIPIFVSWKPGAFLPICHRFHPGPGKDYQAQQRPGENGVSERRHLAGHRPHVEHQDRPEIL